MGVSLLYQASYLAVFSALLLWMLLAEYKSAGRYLSFIFFFAFTAWVISIIQSDTSNSAKLLIVFRDMITAAVGSLIIYQARSNKMIGILALIGMFFIMKTWYLPVLKETFAPKSTNDIALDRDGELLIDLASGVDPQMLVNALDNQEVRVVRAFYPADEESTDLDEYYLIDLPQDMSSDETAAIRQRVERSGLADWVEENEVVSIEPLEGSITQRRPPGSKLNDPYVHQQWAFEALDVSTLHEVLSNISIGKKARIAILDTGVDGKHEDLAENYFSVKKSYDRDIKGHGTHVAGIAAAVSNNGKGIASFLPNDKLVGITSIKVLTDMGMGSQATIIRGMIEAADYGVDVISMSLGGRTNESKQLAYTQALEYCNSRGAIVVVAAGNANMNAKEISPANTPGVIVVSAVNSNFEKAYFSNTVSGMEYPVAAPGDDIFSTYPRNQYKSFKGTSMAAPFVASMVGIMKCLDPEITTHEAHELLVSTGIDSKSTISTGRIIQPSKAISSLAGRIKEPL